LHGIRAATSPAEEYADYGERGGDDKGPNAQRARMISDPIQHDRFPKNSVCFFMWRLFYLFLFNYEVRERSG
jgi:hypothetical protein